jgi:hypothetical protein
MPTQLSTSYDVWRCARCGAERWIPSHPHQTLTCCGTGMWWIRFVHGRPYEYEVFGGFRAGGDHGLPTRRYADEDR